MPILPTIPANGDFSASWRARAWQRIQSTTTILIVALVVRLAVAEVFLGHTPPSWGVNEAAGIARQICAGHGFASPFHDSTGPTAWLAPIYPATLACIFRVFGVETPASTWAAVLLNVIFGSLTAAVVLRLGKKSFGPLAGVIAGWAWAISPPVIVMPWYVWETSLSALVMSLALLQTLHLDELAPLRDWIFCGCIWGFAALLNPTLLAPLPVLAILAAHRSNHLIRVAMMLVVCALCVTPWTLRNFAAFGHVVPVRSNFWPEAYFGNVTFDLHPTGPSMAYQQEGEIGFARELHLRVIEQVQSHPGEFVRRTGQRFLTFWTGPAHFGLYAPLLSLAAIAGVVLARRTRHEWIAFASVLALYPMIYYVTYTFARYRFPIDPVLYTLSGYLAAEGCSYIQRWRRGKAA